MLHGLRNLYLMRIDLCLVFMITEHLYSNIFFILNMQ
jgi:hypothetical protein